MQPIPYMNLKVDGDLYRRTILNYDRLETEEYRYPNVFKETGYSWPADWEGRAILALTLLAQATGREPAYLEEIIQRLPEHLNEKGYFGTIHSPGTIDEQQLSGHSWFLRAMVEYHLWKKDDLSLRIIKNVVSNLILPARGNYTDYPMRAEDRNATGEAIGSLIDQKVGNWYLSTDVGCAFILLDGASHAYQLLKWPELGALLEEMIDKFRTIDLSGLSFQTHATLSALRGILRHYETTKDPSLLELAQDRFTLYRCEGITENFANYNWFGKPEWTEPCAIVDSFIVAVTLWEHTRESDALELAHGILYNGLGYGQRPNGGFGCDCCVGAHTEFLTPINELFEAYWCCTMRGGDGLSRAIGYSYFVEASQNTINVPFLLMNEAEIHLSGGMLTLKQATSYPVQGIIQLELTNTNITEPITMRIFVPTWAEEKIILRVDNLEEVVRHEGCFVVWKGIPHTGLKLELTFPVGLRLGHNLNIHSITDAHSLFHGPLLLGMDNMELPLDELSLGQLEPLEDAIYQIKNSNKYLRPIRDMLHLTMDQAVANRQQVLFKLE